MAATRRDGVVRHPRRAIDCMIYADLAYLGAHASIFTAAVQRQLSELIEHVAGEDYRWNVDIPSGSLVFTGPQGRLTCRCHFVASVAGGPRSIMWAWAHPQLSGDLAGALRAYGEAHGIATLANGTVDFPATTGLTVQDEAAQIAHECAQVAIAITGPRAYYTMPASPISLVVALLDVPGLAPVRIDERLPAAIRAALDLGVADHRQAFVGLAALAGWPLDTAATPWRMVDPVNGNAAELSFDTAGRLSNVELHLHPPT